MNTQKKKNKNRSKNPVPPQNTHVKDGEKTDISVPTVESQLKTDERVPEILSEVVNLAVEETKDDESNDSPKKPKRNRGKKKKGDKDEPVDVAEEKTPTGEFTEETTISGEKKDNGKKEQQKAIKSEINVPAVATNRKKKNKDNTNKVLQPEIESAETESKNEPISENYTIKDEYSIISESKEQETKSTKKKNKKNKKQRNDSEKSDFQFERTDEAAYIGAVQKNIQDNVVTEIKQECATKLETSFNTPINIQGDAVTSPQEIDTPKDEGSKTKKKNKKEKKHLRTEENSDVKLTSTQLFNISSDVKPMTFVELGEEKDVIEIREEDSNIVIITADVIDNVTLPITKEQSPKPKAKIAKPVEKKGKDKISDLPTKNEDTVLKEIISKDKLLEIKPETIEEEDDLIMCPITDDPFEDDFVENTKNKEKCKSSNEIKEQYMGKGETKEQDENLSKEPETINAETAIQKLQTDTVVDKSDEMKSSSDGQKRKKAKKGKQPLLVDKVTTVDEKERENPSEMSLESIMKSPDTFESMNIGEPVKDAVETKVEPSQIQQQQILKAIPLPDFMSEAVTPKIQNTTKESETKDPIAIEVEMKSATEVMSSAIPLPDKIHIEEPLATNIRNKIPNPFGELAQSPAKNLDFKVQPCKETEEKKDIISTIQGNKGESNVNTIKSEEYKNVSMKIDLPQKSSQASAKTPTDITPDMIESPRSTSADIIDGNNNMMIREITLPTALMVPVVIPDTPLISSLDESQKYVSDEIKNKEVKDLSTSVDVKSKIIEVNRDMEDLRLSIERSLAELTALEKTDEEFGIKQIETKLFDGDVKKDAPHPLTPIQETEVQLKLPTDLVKEQNQSEHKCAKTDPETDLPVTEDGMKNVSSIKSSAPPVCPGRKDNKGKSKSKKKEIIQVANPLASSGDHSQPTTSESTQSVKKIKKEDKSEEKNQSNTQEGQGQQRADFIEQDNLNQDTTIDNKINNNAEVLFNPIEHFEDAMTSSADDVNKSFEVIANEASTEIKVDQKPNPQINITEPDDVDRDKEKKQDAKQENINPVVSQPKNLLGHPVIPVRSNKMDYKKEKNKTLNLRQAKVKIKDSNDVEKIKESKESQTENKPKLIKSKGFNESVTCVTSENDEFIYKYSFRKVFLSTCCHVCKKELKENRVACEFCNLLYYCGKKHRDEDFPQHQAFCVAVSTICHLKGLKYIYADTQGVTGQDYRLLRMQLIVSCEQVLKRRLQPSEQEMLLYPRVCADGSCRQWRAGLLTDCPGCGMISYCTANLDHLPKSHSRWCKSYSLYQKLVVHQLSRGRLEPRLPTRLLTSERICDNINRLLADLYDERIDDMSDIQYAALTQLATAPLTAAFSYQLYKDKMKGVQNNGANKEAAFTIHVVGAELQFEADSLNKWEVFFLHLRPNVEELTVVLVGTDLNPSNLPLDLLGNIKLCPSCRVDKRRVIFKFQDKVSYQQYRDGEDFIHPDIICAFNPSIHRSARYNQSTWTPTLNSIFKLKRPFCITAYSMNELQRDLVSVKGNSHVDFNVVSEAKFNPFASVRPDRNFITDDEIPLLFKNYCYSVLIGAF